MPKTLSILLSVAGAMLFLYGSNQAETLSLAEDKISQAEVADHHRPILGPVRRGARNQAEESKHQILSEKEQKIATSQVSAYWLRGIGAALLIIGIGGLIFYRKK